MRKSSIMKRNLILPKQVDFLTYGVELKIQGSNEILIYDVTKGSVAHSAGVKIGNVILELNGICVTDLPILTVKSLMERSKKDVEILILDHSSTVLTVENDIDMNNIVEVCNKTNKMNSLQTSYCSMCNIHSLNSLKHKEHLSSQYHKMMEEFNVIRKTSCSICNKQIHRLVDLKSHLSSRGHKKNKRAQTKSKWLKNSPELLNCSCCNKQFSKWYDYNQHLKSKAHTIQQCLLDPMDQCIERSDAPMELICPLSVHNPITTSDHNAMTIKESIHSNSLMIEHNDNQTTPFQITTSIDQKDLIWV